MTYWCVRALDDLQVYIVGLQGNLQALQTDVVEDGTRRCRRNNDTLGHEGPGESTEEVQHTADFVLQVALRHIVELRRNFNLADRSRRTMYMSGKI